MYYAIKAPPFALKNSKTPLYIYINFHNFFNDIDKGEIIEVLPRKLSLEESFKKMLFPFYELEGYTKWIDAFEDYMLSSSENGKNDRKIRQIRRIIDKKLRHILEGFEIPYISLPESMELLQITDIFERINTMGKKLNAFDLLIARLSKYDIDLKKLWEEAYIRYPMLEEFDRTIDKMPIYILQAISLYYNRTSACSREDILNIYQSIFEPTGMSFEETWYEMSEFINKAIFKLENLRDGFGVKDETELPFAPMVPILATLIREIETRQNKVECYKKLRIWYWSSVFSNAYSGAVDSQLTADIKEMRDWFSYSERTPKTVDRLRKEFDALDLRQVQSKGSAMYRGVLSLLALEGSRDFDTNQALENARSNDKDHIFPKREFGSRKYINSILNITWMSDETNRKIKRYERPSNYVQKFIAEKYSGERSDFLEVLETHFINKDNFENMLTIILRNLLKNVIN